MPFVPSTSIVREIWGKSDTILLIFAGAAAEFALNKAVDWLYFTGRLPADPLERLFSTVTYAREIIFSSTEKANAAIDKMRSIHTAVETSRGAAIPDAAYRDVLFMLIHYSITSFEALERKLTTDEKEEITSIFCRVGKRMGIPGLPTGYDDWKALYHQHSLANLRKSRFTDDLFRQYKKHLGTVRFLVLKASQRLVVSEHVRHLLGMGKPFFIVPVVFFYRLLRNTRPGQLMKSAILPPLYKQRISRLDFRP